MKFSAMIMAVAAALAVAGSANAQAPARRVCDPGNSQKVTVAAVAADPAAFMGKCVRVDAIYSNERLYADEDAIYGLNAKSIGGYVDGQGDVTGFWTGTFTGRVADCARAEDDLLTGLLRSPGISLNYRTLGCLAPEGPFLVFMSQGELKPSKLKRRLPGAKGANLTAIASPVRDMRAEQFLKALREGDEKQLMTITGASQYSVQQLLADDTAITKLRGLGDRPMQAFKPIGQTVDQRGHQLTSVTCWCLTADCSKRWPIAVRDADNQSTRPYACIKKYEWSEGGDVVFMSLDPSRDFDGLPEPR
jgi:hypothetical protein